MDKAAARERIAHLVERFQNTPPKTLADYQEQQMREYFILPLFRALGWSTENPAEMSAEEQISRGFVDFGFYLNGVPAFYLETKRASEKLEQPKNMKQAINYSYMKGVPWAVLTDFSGLMVFNADVEGDPVQARMFNLKYSDYLTNSGFEDLWLLSKESLQKREIDRVAERYGKKNKKEPVTTRLFASLTEWRRDLFQDMYLQRATLWASDPHEVDNAVQRFLDRLIFIRTVEDRGIERNRLKALLREESQRSKWFPRLLQLFVELRNVYNSNLFAEHRADDMQLHDPNLLEKIINRLYSVPDHFGNSIDYDFNAITADVLGAVYEQYLGFRAQDPEGKQALDIRKKQKRKQQGIYYTPQFVVRYIVRQTLGKILNPSPESTPEAGASSSPSLLPNASPTTNISEVERGTKGVRLNIDQTRKLRILDPACGSGAFLIEAFDVLDKHYEALHAHLSENEKINKRREWRGWILKENLYGVDLDDQAVEVTRLNLMLRGAQTREKLPLLTNIVHGNSLIEDDEIAGAGLGLKWEQRFPKVFAGEHRSLWFVTFVTHNSRISERMITYGIQAGEPIIFSPAEQILMTEKIAEACRKYAVPVVAWNVLPDHVHMVIGAEDEQALEKVVGKIKGYSSRAFKQAQGDEQDSGLADSNLADSGFKPTVSNSTVSNRPISKDAAAGNPYPIWARKFNRQPIHNPESLSAIINYVTNNHYKHAERWGNSLIELWEKGLQSQTVGLNPLSAEPLSPNIRPLSEIVRELCVSSEEASSVRGGFDVVIGNPPYGASTSPEQVRYFRAKYRASLDSLDSFALFMEKSNGLLRQGGLFGMIVPSGWVSTPSTKSLRRLFASQYKPIAFASMPYDVFKGAYVDTVIVTAEKLPIGKTLHDLPQAPVEIVVFPPRFRIQSEKDFEEHQKITDARKWLNSKDIEFLITASDIETGLIEKVRHVGGKFADVADIQRGVTPFNTSSEKPHVNARPAFTGTVRRYDLTQEQSDYIRYDETLAEYKPEKYFCGQRLLLRELISRQFQLQAMYTANDFITNKSMQSILLTDIRYNLLYLLGLLNSKLISWHFLETNSVARRDDFPKIVLKQTRELPFRKINFDDPADKARHDKMVSLVEQMLLLKQQHAAANATHDDRRHELQARIDAADRQIDQLVYELYGLTDDEIKIIEGS